MKKFNVLHEPWIPVLNKDGTTQEYGVWDVLTKAQDFEDIVCDSPLEEYAVKRFLIAFLMDAYQLERLRDRRRLFQEGRFSEQVLTAYVQLCESEGVTFDLFDKKRPFMQSCYDEKLDAGKEKSVANLFHALPTGNNHIHFDHVTEKEREFTPAECMRGILAAQIFSVAMTGDYPSSVNDTPCYYVILKGNSLFEQLVLNMLSKGESPQMVWGDPPVAWRNLSEVVPKALSADISLSEGLTWQSRRILLKEEEDEKVRSMFFQPGRNFHQNEKWRDPFVSFATSKEGKLYTLKPRVGREPWRDVGVFLMSKDDRENRPATVICQAKNIVEDDPILQMKLYGLATSNAKYEGWVADELSIRTEVIFDYDKADRLRKDVAVVEEVARLIYCTIRDIGNAQEHTDSNKKRESSFAEEAEASFFSGIHTFIFTTYMEKLALADSSAEGWETTILELLNKKIAEDARKIVCVYENRFGNTARELEIQNKVLRKFGRGLQIIMERRRTE